MSAPLALTKRAWVFPDSEVRILSGDDTFLGKGAYGEVRRGVWRGIPVAAKRLHMLSSGMSQLCTNHRFLLIAWDSELRVEATLLCHVGSPVFTGFPPVVLLLTPHV